MVHCLLDSHTKSEHIHKHTSSGGASEVVWRWLGCGGADGVRLWRHALWVARKTTVGKGVVV